MKTSSPEISKLFDQLAADQIPDQETRTNICPTQDILTVRIQAGRQHATMLRWGLVPFWAKELKIGAKMINARSETVFEKPAFRNAAKSKRCVIVADGFYEWKAIAGQKKKQPYLVARSDRSPWCMAGLWERWTDPAASESGSAVVETCTIITTAANDFMRDLHDRMPVILEPHQVNFWLDSNFSDRKELQSMLAPREWAGFEMSEASLGDSARRSLASQDSADNSQGFLF